MANPYIEKLAIPQRVIQSYGIYVTFNDGKVTERSARPRKMGGRSYMTVWVAKGFLTSRHGGGDSPAHGGPKEAKARRRVEKSNGTLYWYGGGSDVLYETDLSGGNGRDYIFFGGRRLARFDETPQTIYHYFEDHLGSSRVIVQSNTNTPCYDADFGPYGKEAVYTNTCAQNYKFTGKERDSETGNDYFGARYYENNLGRFMSSDPVSLGLPRGAMVDNPQRWNSYAYGLNNPLRFIDRDGRFSDPIHAGITEGAALNKGYSPATVRIMIQANLNVDRESNFLNNHEHGMRNAFESKAHAAQAVDKVIDYATSQAVSHALKGQYTAAAQSLGAGMHTVQDLVAHQLSTLVGHGRESTNDNDPQKRSTAESNSEKFLTSFDSAIIKAVGPDKANEILANVRDAGDQKLSETGSQHGPEPNTSSQRPKPLP